MNSEQNPKRSPAKAGQAVATDDLPACRQVPKELNAGYIIAIPQKQKPPMNEHRGNN